MRDKASFMHVFFVACLGAIKNAAFSEYNVFNGSFYAPASVRLCRRVLKSCRLELQNAARQAFSKYIGSYWHFYAPRLLIADAELFCHCQSAKLCRRVNF